MQQTNQYQFNLIESGDTFSAEPLNENAEKMEELFLEVNEQIALSANNVRIGTFEGDGSSTRFVNLGCTPKLIIMITEANSGAIISFTTAICSCYANSNYVSMSESRITEGGISIASTMNNTAGRTTTYILFL